MTLGGRILKPNMVLPGLTCAKQEGVDEVADTTVKCLLRAVPAAVPGIAFLSGGQPSELASARLNAMNFGFNWAVAFSFARAIQQPALKIWRGKESNVSGAQQALSHRAGCNRAARRGEYNAALDQDMSATTGARNSRNRRRSSDRSEGIELMNENYRAHQDWKVWVGLFFRPLATTLFVLSDNLAFLPQANVR